MQKHATRTPIFYFAGESEKARLAEYGLLSHFDANFVLRDKLRYVDFLPFLARAQFVVTDSGGVQEESGHLGIPCAVHRLKTERLKGQGTNMVLTGMETDRLKNFLENVDDYRSSDDPGLVQPSVVIVDTLEKLG